MGIYLPPQSNRVCSMLNFNSVTLLVSLIQMILTSTAFILYEAESVFEYGYPTYVSITLASCVVLFFIELWKIDDILQFINALDDFVKKSKLAILQPILECSIELTIVFILLWNSGLQHSPVSRIHYLKLVDKIDLLCSWLYVSLKLLAVGLFLPPLLLTITNYFVFNMDDDSYYFPCPAMCVQLVNAMMNVLVAEIFFL